jgi:hypothetical protein
LTANAGAFPKVATMKKVVKEKSKADALAKGLICIQVGWMLVQTIARKFSGLPITLLELSTLAHVSHALILYLVWLDKPQDVQEPEIIYANDSLSVLLSGIQRLQTRQCRSMRGSRSWGFEWKIAA